MGCEPEQNLISQSPLLQAEIKFGQSLLTVVCRLKK